MPAFGYWLAPVSIPRVHCVLACWHDCMGVCPLPMWWWSNISCSFSQVEGGNTIVWPGFFLGVLHRYMAMTSHHTSIILLDFVCTVQGRTGNREIGQPGVNTSVAPQTPLAGVLLQREQSIKQSWLKFGLSITLDGDVKRLVMKWSRIYMHTVCQCVCT